MILPGSLCVLEAILPAVGIQGLFIMLIVLLIVLLDKSGISLRHNFLLALAISLLF